jgi:DNA modification methylase
MKNKLIIDGKEIDLPQELVNEIKGKLSNKEKEMEQFFLDCFNGCEIVLKDGSVYYKKDGGVIMEQDLKNDYFWFHYSKIWSVFETKYSMNNHEEIQRFLKSMLDLHLKLGSYTHRRRFYVAVVLAFKIIM